MLVNQVLPPLHLRMYSNILIRQESSCGVIPLGGGSVENICRRFGNLEIDYIDIGEYVLFIYVKQI